jgi:hypothetical protein
MWQEANPKIRGTEPEQYQAFQAINFYTRLAQGYVSIDESHAQYNKAYDDFGYFSYS